MASRTTSADQSMWWAIGVLGAGASVKAATRREQPVARIAATALAGSFGFALFGARRMVTNAISEAVRRETHQRILADAQLGQALGGAHDSLNSVEPELRALLRHPECSVGMSLRIAAALQAITTLAELLRNSARARDALLDENGVVPLLGVSAAQQHKQGPRAVKPLYGARDGLPSFVPSELRAAARQVGLVLDEIRLSHTADVERSVLLFTLLSRAVLVSLSPLLGGWSPVRQPLAGGLQATDLPWIAASTTSIVTALAGPWVVRLVMEDNARGRRFRRHLLLIETPIAAVTLFFSPSWTVVVFASGVTNWWQRQNNNMSFNWNKLLIYVVGVVLLQSLGLARDHIALDPASLEIIGALTAILITGASYGAMLPVTIGTALDVLIGDGRRSLRAVIRARGELLRAAHQLNETADAIEAAAPESEATRVAAMTARRAALQIERAADRAGRRSLIPSHLLPELTAEAIARSFLPRRGTTELLQLQTRARESGQAAPAYATEPIFLVPELSHTRIAEQRDARTMRAIIEHSLNEARIHGTGAVRLILDSDGSTLTVRVGNRPMPEDAAGLAGQGARDLARLAGRIADGHIERGLLPADQIRMPGGGDWWVVTFTCSAGVFE